MENFIQEYLSLYYKIAYSELGNGGVYDINNNPKYRAPESSKKLLKEINKVFYISEEDVKNQINIWATTLDPNIDLEFYWKEDFGLTFANSIAVKTIGMDLVSVQPMSGPTGHLMYLNYE